MEEQERNLEQLLATANRLLDDVSVVGEHLSSSRIAELQALRDGLHQELTRCRVRYFLETLRA